MGMILSLGLLFSFACQDTAPADPAILELTLKSNRTEVTLGEEVQFEVTLKNISETEQVASQILLEERSLSFEIKIPSREKAFRYTLTLTDPHVAARLPLPEFSLPKGGSANTHIRLPAIEVGEMEVVALYSGADKEVRSGAVKVTVAKSSVGDHLAAIMEIRNANAEKVESVSFKLLPGSAPVNVINFIRLVKAGFYDGMLFHRVIKGSWIQSGCPYGLGIGGPGYAIGSESEGQAEKHDPGTLSLSGYEKTGYTGSQFFITLGKIPALDGKYTVIGRISDDTRMKFLKSIGKVSVDKNNDRPRKDVELVRISIVVE